MHRRSGLPALILNLVSSPADLVHALRAHAARTLARTLVAPTSPHPRHLAEVKQ